MSNRSTGGRGEQAHEEAVAPFTVDTDADWFRCRGWRSVRAIGHVKRIDSHVLPAHRRGVDARWASVTLVAGARHTE